MHTEPPSANGRRSRLHAAPAPGEEVEPAGAPATKVYVLDTSVILYDGQALSNFQEHDVAVPLTVLEELDQFKKGNSVMNLQAREFIRQLDQLSGDNMLREWIPLNGPTHGRVRVLGDRLDGGAPEPVDAAELFGTHKNDHRILNAVLKLRQDEPERKVVLVSKDINLRLKARALELVAEDYKTIAVRDVDNLYRGHAVLEVAEDAPIDRLYAGAGLAAADLGLEPPLPNHYFILRSPRKSALARYDVDSGSLRRVLKLSAYGITPRNAEQTFALDAILDPGVQLVTLSGAAGTGKTLIALAGALEQRRHYRQIFLSRPIVPLSNRDIGYLPGDIHSKINPYMQPLWDNLSFIKSQFEAGEKDLRRIDEMVEQEKLHVVPLAYIRGRSFTRVLFIVDEAQNLTPHEVKTIITRAGEGTKIVLTGDIFQIDTPYLDSQSNGLTYLIDRLKGNPLHAHVNLVKGERSALANLASELL
ncbi:MAG TPA: PhoH family protein [Thermoanaerobaculia bacterium]|nr:PhoH family protein [Thermoanaerobaculia bacterium]